MHAIIQTLRRTIGPGASTRLSRVECGWFELKGHLRQIGIRDGGNTTKIYQTFGG